VNTLDRLKWTLLYGTSLTARLAMKRRIGDLMAVKAPPINGLC
jgi:ABC-type sulfate transport system permease subunit